MGQEFAAHKSVEGKQKHLCAYRSITSSKWIAIVVENLKSKYTDLTLSNVVLHIQSTSKLYHVIMKGAVSLS